MSIEEAYQTYDERRRRMTAQAAARLLDEQSGFAFLNDELMKKGFRLAAHVQDHDLHIVMGETRSECHSCMEALYPR